MEKIEYYRANFDYEFELYGLAIDPKKKKQICAEFEYLFLLLSLDKPLLLHGELDATFLCNFVQGKDYIYKYGEKRINLWGALTNLPLERRLNSKIFSLEVEKSLNINFAKKRVINSKGEWDKLWHQFSAKFPLIIQSPFLFSGFKQKIIRHANQAATKVEYPIIVSNYLRRCVDFGCWVEQEQIFIYLNLVNKNGQYRGTILGKDDTILAQAVATLYNLEVLQIHQFLLAIRDYAKQICRISGVSSLQFDSFLYWHNDELCLLPLAEINYRKTMGYLFSLLADNNELWNFFRLVPFGSIDNRLLKSQKISPCSKHRFDLFHMKISNISMLVDEFKQFEIYDPSTTA